jgi:hypothetical protein
MEKNREDKQKSFLSEKFMAWLLKKMSRAAGDIGGGAIISILSGRTTGRTRAHTQTYICIYAA